MRPSWLFLSFLLLPALLTAWPYQRRSDYTLTAPNEYQCEELGPPFNHPTTGVALVVREANTGPVQLRVGAGPLLLVLQVRCDGGLGTCEGVTLQAGELAPGIRILEQGPGGQAWFLCHTQSKGVCPNKKPGR